MLLLFLLMNPIRKYMGLLLLFLQVFDMLMVA